MYNIILDIFLCQNPVQLKNPKVVPIVPAGLVIVVARHRKKNKSLLRVIENLHAIIT